MPVSVGFVILSHRPGDQLLRLTKTLAAQYDDPPVAVHHDFSQAAIDTGEFGPTVRFVTPHVPTSWGKFSVVDAALAGLRLLYEAEGPDWFFLLSAQDYPVMRGRAVREELSACDCDALIDLRALDPHASAAATLVGTENPVLRFFSEEWNRELKRRFYRAPQYWLPTLRLRPRLRLGRMTYRPNREGRHPFASDFEAYFGDHWFAGNRRVADVLIHPTPRHSVLRRHLLRRPSADECYYQTVLANTPGLRLCKDNRRFARWAGHTGPESLGENDLESIVWSKAFFARKFDEDAPVLDRIDGQLL